MKLLKTAIVAIGLHSCVLLGADFFPLQTGNTWTYREPVSGQTFSVRVGQPVMIAGHEYYELTGYANADLLVRVEEMYGTLVYWDGLRNEDTLLTSFEQFEGGHWLAPFRPCPEQDGQGQLKLGNHDGPAGPIPGVLEIQYRAIGCADVGLTEEQYADHLGMLRRVASTIAGPRTFDLIAARIGSITIDAGPHAGLSVSLAPATTAGAVPATLRRSREFGGGACAGVRFRAGILFCSEKQRRAYALEVVRGSNISAGAAPKNCGGRVERDGGHSLAGHFGRGAAAWRLYGGGCGHE